MRVLQINQTCGRGSTGKIAAGIGRILKEQGHESYIAFGYGKTEETDTLKLKRIGDKNSMRIELMKCRLTGYFGFTNKRGTRRLINWIEEIKPDIIHLHNIHGGYIHIEVLFEYLSKKNIPIVWTLHDCWSFTGHCSHFQIVNCDKWKTGCYKCPEKNNYPKRYFFDRSKEQYERKKRAFTSVKNMTFVTPSDWLGNLARESFFKDYPVYTVNNGIDLSVFKPTENNIKEKLGIKDKKMVLGVQLSWSERKGLKYIVELSRILDSSYQIVLIGLTERRIKKLPENIIGIKAVGSQRELAEYYTAADVFVNTTLEETFGLVTIEALACGTPVVTFDAGGCAETIDKTCGVLIPKGDIEKMAAGIYHITVKNCEKACMERANKFEDEKKYAEYVNIYKKILKG